MKEIGAKLSEKSRKKANSLENITEITNWSLETEIDGYYFSRTIKRLIVEKL